MRCGGLAFSPSHGDGMVLQRSPSVASVYGSIGTGQKCPSEGKRRPKITVTIFGDAEQKSEVTVAGSSSSSSNSTLHSVEADVYQEDLWGSETGCSFRALLRPFPAGGSYVISAQCHAKDGEEEDAPPSSGGSATIRNVTFGDVWYCAGQSNMALPLRYTVQRNASLAAIQAGRYDNIRIHGLEGNMNCDQKWSTASDAVREDTFLTFSGTCWYFAERLTDELRRGAEVGGGDVPPVGLIHTAWGGSTIEDWLDTDTVASACDDVCHDERRNKMFEKAVLPYVNTTIKGWVWYQGENNMGAGSELCVLGNSLRRSGYSCLMVQLVRLWRSLWSQISGTTDPLAPFGVVTLPHSGSEGNRDMGTMRWAQTGGYGVLPNPVMPNTFLVQAYDIDDPYQVPFDLCIDSGCCYPAKDLFEDGPCKDGDQLKARYAGFECHMCPDLCNDFCASAMATPFFMGPIHPRTKMAVGSRLGVAAARTVYGLSGDLKEGSGAATGPTLAGCRLDNDLVNGSSVITLLFNRTLLAGDRVYVQEYDRSRPGLSKLEVLLRPSPHKVLCLQTAKGKCIDDGHGKSYLPNRNGDGRWVPVDIVTEGYATAGGYEVTADLGSISVPSAIRYAWTGTCCDGGDQEIRNNPQAWTRHCPLGSCPIVARPSGLPANPFLAEIIHGRCSCLPPQQCNASDSSELVSPVKESPVLSVVENERGRMPSSSTTWTVELVFAVSMVVVGLWLAAWRLQPTRLKVPQTEMVPLQHSNIDEEDEK